jgi:hypothetical protein
VARAPKPAVKALFAAMESAREAELMLTLKLPKEPPPGRAIEVDPLWLSTMGVKGRA